MERVKPERDRSNEQRVKTNWWLHGRTRDELRQSIVSLPRYIATVETAKHRVFQFLDASILPDNMLIAIALDDAFYLGVLSSRIHRVWALAAGGTLEDRPRYNKSRCFDPFPFPDATPAQQARIRELAEALDAHRKRQQALHPSLTLTDLYNVVEKLRASQPLTAKEQATHAHGLAAVVLSLHQQLDAAVAAAYHWPADLPAPDLLTRLVQLNHQRRQEEAAGTIRYLRPAYQAKSVNSEQLTMNSGLPSASKLLTDNYSLSTVIPWPPELYQQMQLVRGIIVYSPTPLSSAQVAARFQRGSAKKIQPLLDTLAAMFLVRQVEGEWAYAG